MIIIDRTSASANHFHTTRSTRHPDGRCIFPRVNGACVCADPSRRRPRAPSELRGVFLHQTDFENANVDRYDNIIAHFVVMRSGAVLMIREPTTRLQSVSARDGIDIEFEGQYLSTRLLRRGRGTSAPTLPQIMAGRNLLEHLNKTLGVSGVWGHCQTSQLERDNCPGPQLWYNVAQWAIDTLGMTNAGLGNSVPVEWQNPALDLVWPAPLPRPPGDEASSFHSLLTDIIEGR